MQYQVPYTIGTQYSIFNTKPSQFKLIETWSSLKWGKSETHCEKSGRMQKIFTCPISQDAKGGKREIPRKVICRRRINSRLWKPDSASALYNNDIAYMRWEQSRGCVNREISISAAEISTLSISLSTPGYKKFSHKTRTHVLRISNLFRGKIMIS